MVEPKYKRVLIKLSGEALAGERGVGIDLPTVQTMAKEIAEVAESGVQIALVIGGGNLWRGEPQLKQEWIVFKRTIRGCLNSYECPCYGRQFETTWC